MESWWCILGGGLAGLALAWWLLGRRLDRVLQASEGRILARLGVMQGQVAETLKMSKAAWRSELGRQVAIADRERAARELAEELPAVEVAVDERVEGAFALPSAVAVNDDEPTMLAPAASSRTSPPPSPSPPPGAAALAPVPTYRREPVREHLLPLAAQRRLAAASGDEEPNLHLGPADETPPRGTRRRS